MSKEKKRSGRMTTVLLVMIFVIGLSLLLYPSIANYVNSLHSSKAISDYSQSVSNLSAEQYEKMFREAEEYNLTLYQRTNAYVLEETQQLAYWDLLNINGDGIMGYIEIPSLSVMLPIYHGTDDNVLQVAVGHLDWTSLPVGGINTHSVLSGHRGLPSAKLFTDLDKLIEGDIFLLRILNEVFTYEVDQILIVEPEDASALVISEGEDLCTLVTCTPYGINSHRMLVRGHRIENAEDAISVTITSEMIQIDELIVATVLAVPILILLMLIVLLKGNGGKRPVPDAPAQQETPGKTETKRPRKHRKAERTEEVEYDENEEEEE